MQLTFKQTAVMCPEQYDVVDENGKIRGYVRLRYGLLTVECPDVGGETVYKKKFEDEWAGCFYDEDERERELFIIRGKIERWWENHGASEGG